MTDKEHLLSVYANRIINEKTIFRKINEENDFYYSVPFLEGVNVVYALHSMFIEHDFIKARNLFFKAALAAEYMSFKFDRRIIDTGINQISYALLSDNQEFIKRYSVLKNSINDETSIGYQLPNAIQNILLEEWDKLDWNIRCLERFVKVPRFTAYAGVINVLQGFKRKDHGLIEDGLKELLATYKKRKEGDPLIYKFFSIDTSGFTKLAWIKGYEIDLKSTLVPIELMPVKPLEHYESYDFLDL